MLHIYPNQICRQVDGVVEEEQDANYDGSNADALVVQCAFRLLFAEIMRPRKVEEACRMEGGRWKDNLERRKCYFLLS